MLTGSGLIDPDLWAAIDIGLVVYRSHYAATDAVATWESRTTIVAGAALAAFAGNEAMKGAMFTFDDPNGVADVEPKIYRLVDYLVWVAANERYMDIPSLGRSDKVSRFYRKDELFLSLINRGADAALTMRSVWSQGPVSSATTAARGHQLMTEVL